MQKLDHSEPASKRWRFDDPWLLWLFPASYTLHLLEEVWVRSPVFVWGLRLQPGLMPVPFAVGNVAGFVLMVLGIRLVARGRRFAWIVPALAMAVLLNTLGHVVGAWRAAAYSAGLVSAVVVWTPLGLLTLLRAGDQTSARSFRAGVLVGAFVELAVVLFSTLSNLSRVSPV